MLSVLLVGCGSSKEVKNEKLNWTITILKAEEKAMLNATDEVRQYDGSVAKVNHQNKPQNGKKYLMIQLDLKKNVAGNHPFIWNNLALNGKDDSYKRLNDIFLADYKYKRIPATDLKLDTQGWICFEVPNNSTIDTFKLLYKENGKQNIIPLKK